MKPKKATRFNGTDWSGLMRPSGEAKLPIGRSVCKELRMLVSEYGRRGRHSTRRATVHGVVVSLPALIQEDRQCPSSLGRSCCGVRTKTAIITWRRSREDGFLS